MSATTITRQGFALDTIQQFAADKLRYALVLKDKAVSALTAAWHAFTSFYNRNSLTVASGATAILSSSHVARKAINGLKWAITKAQEGFDWALDTVGKGLGWVGSKMLTAIGWVSPIARNQVERGIAKLANPVMRLIGWSYKVRTDVTKALFDALDRPVVANTIAAAAGAVSVLLSLNLITNGASVGFFLGVPVIGQIAAAVSISATLAFAVVGISLVGSTAYAMVDNTRITAKVNKANSTIKTADSMVREARNIKAGNPDQALLEAALGNHKGS